MKKFICLLLLCLALYVYAERVEPYSGSRIFWDVSSRTTIFSNGGYGRVIQLQNGQLLAVATNGTIEAAFSNDCGNTWEPNFTIATPKDSFTLNNPEIIQLLDGTLIVSYGVRPITPFSKNRLYGLRCKHSTDNGATWSDEIFVYQAGYENVNGCWEPCILELPSGELHLYFADEVPFSCLDPREQQISMLRSYDKGLTWEGYQRVSYRNDYRDGMPVPILSSDGKEIIVAIEDNGWGYWPDFFPTTIRCPIDVNWNNYYVNTDSPNREKILDFNYCAPVTGGAPYLRKLGNDETVFSWQSTYNTNNVRKMCVAVGNAEAKAFKAISQPFLTSPEEATEWNSLTVVDGVVYAIGTINRMVEMEKGYPMKQFEVGFGSPKIDGKIDESEGYYSPYGKQIPLGTQTGTISYCDFAYDKDSLYFVVWVNDTDQILSSSYQDCVRLYIDAMDTCDTNPISGTYEYVFNLRGKTECYHGAGYRWRYVESDDLHCAIDLESNHYIVETAIPWSNMGLENIPTHPIAAMIEIQNGSGVAVATETIPDADHNAPYTWMPLHLQDIESDDKIIVPIPIGNSPNHN